MLGTGIEKFDEEFGGFPRGSLILVEGTPGTGKTSMCMAFLKAGVESGEGVVYASFVEGKRDLASYARRFGIDLLDLEHRGLVKVEEVPTMRGGGEVLLKMLLDRVDELRASRLILDSFTAMRYLFTEEAEVRAFLHNVFLKALKSQGVTTMITLEVLGKERLPVIEEYVADVMISLRQAYTDEGAFTRELRVKKFRGTYLKHTKYCFTLYGGFKLFTWAREVLDEPLIHEEVEEKLADKVSTGVKGLDELLGGGLELGTSTLIVYDDWLPANPLYAVTPAIFQSVIKGRKTLLMPTLGAKRLRQILLTSLSEDQLKRSVKALLPTKEEVRESWVAPLKLRLEEDYELMVSQYLELKRGAVGPTLMVFDLSSLIRFYGREMVSRLDELLRLAKDGGDVALNLAPRSCHLLDEFLAMHDVVLRLYERNGALFLRGIKPPTESFNFDIYREDNVRKVRLVPMV